MNLTVTQIPLLSIKHFWEKYMVFDDDSSYDIRELVDLYNQQERVPVQVATMRAFLSVEYSNVVDSVVMNIKCVLWDKELEIDNAMEVYKQQMDYSCNLDDMYMFYVEYAENHNRMTASKSYFEKHVLL
jgi:hypothetical protein